VAQAHGAQPTTTSDRSQAKGTLLQAGPAARMAALPDSRLAAGACGEASPGWTGLGQARLRCRAPSCGLGPGSNPPSPSQAPSGTTPSLPSTPSTPSTPSVTPSVTPTSPQNMLPTLIFHAAGGRSLRGLSCDRLLRVFLAWSLPSRPPSRWDRVCPPSPERVRSLHDRRRASRRPAPSGRVNRRHHNAGVDRATGLALVPR
jgi:hypothetical protein